MPKPPKKKGPKRPQAAAATTPSTSIAPTIPDSAETSRGRIWRTGLRLLNSALDYGLQHLWQLLFVTIGVPIVTAVGGALLLYFTSGRASWLWPWVTHLLAFWVGILLITTMIVVLAWRKSRKEKQELALLQDAKNLRFTSTKLGYVDYFANKERAEAQLAKVLFPINKEIAGFGKAAKKNLKGLTPNTPFIKRQQLLTELMGVFNEHSARLEGYWQNFCGVR